MAGYIGPVFDRQMVLRECTQILHFSQDFSNNFYHDRLHIFFVAFKSHY